MVSCIAKQDPRVLGSIQSNLHAETVSGFEVITPNDLMSVCEHVYF